MTETEILLQLWADTLADVQAGAETLKDCAPCLNCDHEAPIVAGCLNPEDSQSRRIYGEGGRARRWPHGKAPAC